MQQSAASEASRWSGTPSARPFAMLGLVAVASLVLPLDSVRPREIVAALIGVVALICLYVVASTGSRPRWLSTLPAFAAFAVIALLRDATGGSTSGLSALVAAPTFYLAFVGTRRELRVAIVLTGLTFVIPLLVVGAPRYSSEEWRHALIWTAVVAVVGPIVQRLVLRLQDEREQARRAEARLQMVLDGAELTAVIVTDTDGVITSFGVGAERMLGYRAADIVGRNLVDLHDPAGLSAVAAELDVEPGFAVFAALAGCRAPSRMWTCTRADGSTVPMRSGFTELRDDGALVGYLDVGVDISEGVQIRQSLLDAEQRWRVVMDHLPDITLIVTDPNLDVTLISGAGSMREKIEDKSGRPLAEVVSPDNVTILTDLTTRAIAGSSGNADLNSARTGHEHEIAVVPLPYAGGATDALILARDVSRERARERALMQAKERAERMFADAPVAILLHDTDGLVLSANPAAVALFETPREELVGTVLSRVASDREDLDATEYLRRLRDSDAGSAEGRWRLDLPDGREKFLSLSGRALHDDPDHPDLVLTHVVDRTEQHRHEEQLTHLADHDPLTGLANRRRFDTELARHLETCRRYGPEGALLLLDLDHFKQVNDTLGHPVGDQLLVAVAQLMTEDLRASDTVARLGGDEFAVLLPRVRRDDVDVVASSLVRAVRRSMQRHEGPAAEVTVSMGVALVEDSDLTTEHLMGVADLTLYQAKARGRDQYTVFDPRRPDRGLQVIAGAGVADGDAATASGPVRAVEVTG